MKRFIATILFFTSLIAHAGTHKFHLSSDWYPQSKKVLHSDVQDFFERADDYFPVAVDSGDIRAIIVPHAGYAYSGLCAASVYKELRNNKNIRRVILIGPSHLHAFRGIALPDYNSYQTPLGTIPVDVKACKALGSNKLFSIHTQAHTPEHSLEVQLPFLQKTLRDFKIVPLVVGSLGPSDYDVIAKVLKPFIDQSTLVVVSSDFIHQGDRFGYKPFSEFIMHNIRQVDGQALNAIMNGAADEFKNVVTQTGATICGREPIAILLTLIEQWVFGDVGTYLASYYTSAHMEQYRKSKSVKKLLENVPDSDAQSSVSYMGIVFAQKPNKESELKDLITGYEKKELVRLAREVLENEFADKKIPQDLLYPLKSRGMLMPAGSFVTLNKKSGDLRGCIGHITTPQPLYKTVTDMTRASAFHDSRFSPVKKSELDDIVLDVSVLEPPRKVQSYKDIVLGKHGIILKKRLSGGAVASAVFLPTVPTSYGWTIEETLQHLSTKAGLPADAWKEGCEFEVFEGIELHEN